MGSSLYSLGYQGSTPADLKRYVYGLDAVLVDIRFSPKSMQQIWSQQGLIDLLGTDRYQYCHDLGNEEYRSGKPIRIHNMDRGLAIVQEILVTKSAILMCACWDLMTCHRWVIATCFERFLHVPVEHLPSKCSRWSRVAELPALPLQALPVEQLSLF